MSNIDILSLLDEVTAEEKTIGYLSHPAKHWSIEEKLLYLQGLALVMNTGNTQVETYAGKNRWLKFFKKSYLNVLSSHIDNKNAHGKTHMDIKHWLGALSHSMDLDEDLALESLEVFAQNPDKEVVLAFLNTFRANSKHQIFLYDALSLNQVNMKNTRRGIRVIEKMVEQLKVSTAVWQAIQKLFIQTQEGNVNKAELDKTLLDSAQFQHLYQSATSESARKFDHPFLTNLGEFVEIPAGSFMMGSEVYTNEGPLHKVTLKRFYMQEALFTVAAWDVFVKESGHYWHYDFCGVRGDIPVTSVSYEDIVEKLLPWLNRMTGKSFRLPSEAEWEYAARAGSTTEYSWGDDISPSQANYKDCCHHKTVPVKSYAPNAFGLYDMEGNVWEWTQDCWNDDYNGAPIDGRAWSEGEFDKSVLRGGSFGSSAGMLRLAARYKDSTGARVTAYGFRLVLDC